MFFLAAEPILPGWVVLPLACLAVIVIGVHLQSMHRSRMPESRRRIRTASNLVAMLTVPLLASGFGVIRPDDHRAFVMVWLVVVGLLGIIVMLALVDVLNNIRIHAAERRRVRSEIRRLEGEVRRIVGEQRSTR